MCPNSFGHFFLGHFGCESSKTSCFLFLPKTESQVMDPATGKYSEENWGSHRDL